MYCASVFLGMHPSFAQSEKKEEKHQWRAVRLAEHDSSVGLIPLIPWPFVRSGFTSPPPPPTAWLSTPHPFCSTAFLLLLLRRRRRPHRRCQSHTSLARKHALTNCFPLILLLLSSLFSSLPSSLFRSTVIYFSERWGRAVGKLNPLTLSEIPGARSSFWSPQPIPYLTYGPHSPTVCPRQGFYAGTRYSWAAVPQFSEGQKAYMTEVLRQRKIKELPCLTCVPTRHRVVRRVVAAIIIVPPSYHLHASIAPTFFFVPPFNI